MNNLTRFSTNASDITLTTSAAYINSTNASGAAFDITSIGYVDIVSPGTVTGSVTANYVDITAAQIGTGVGSSALQINNAVSNVTVETQTGAGDAFIRYNGNLVVGIAGGSSGEKLQSRDTFSRRR